VSTGVDIQEGEEGMVLHTWRRQPRNYSTPNSEVIIAFRDPPLRVRNSEFLDRLQPPADRASEAVGRLGLGQGRNVVHFA